MKGASGAYLIQNKMLRNLWISIYGIWTSSGAQNLMNSLNYLWKQWKPQSSCQYFERQMLYLFIEMNY